MMLTIFQTCDFLSDHYPMVREALTRDLNEVQRRLMSGKNVAETQKEKNRAHALAEIACFRFAKERHDRLKDNHNHLQEKKIMSEKIRRLETERKTKNNPEGFP